MPPEKAVVGAPTILIADDSRADRVLTITAFRQAQMNGPIHEVSDGEELMDYLLRQGRYADAPPLAGRLLILLDINMPRKTGFEALAEIRAHPRLCHIPIVMLTTSEVEGDVSRSYGLGANSFVTKQLDFLSFVGLVKQLRSYWLGLVTLPRTGVV
jgi:CheY-like chemotaxis protein